MLYHLYVALIWTVFYGLFVWLFQRETFHTVNRLYLLGSLLVGLVLPQLPIFSIPVDSGEAPVFVLEPILASRTAVETVAHTWVSRVTAIERFFWIIYGAGIGVNGYRFLSGAWQLWRLMHQMGWTKSEKGYRVVEVPGLATPFSFFNILFWGAPATASEADRALMRAHEMAHIRQWHSIDVFCIEVLGVFFWWNPLIYFYKRALRTVHEHLADEAALRQTDTQHYGRLLIGQAQSGPVLALANHFTHSQLKQRILMMMQAKSKPVRRWKYVLFLPVTLLLFTYSGTIEAQKRHTGQYFADADQTDRVVVTTDTVVTFDPSTYEETIRIFQREVHTQVDVMPYFISAWGNCEGQPFAERNACSQRAFGTAVMAELSAPKDEQVRGQVVVRLIVPAQGDRVIIDKVTQSLSPACDAAAVQALALAKGRWLPAQKAGKPVDCVLYVPVVF